MSDTQTLPATVPVSSKTMEEFYGQFGKMPTALNEYARDVWQRSVLFLDILRRRGNKREEMITHKVASVLIYDTELVMRGDELPHPSTTRCSGSSRRKVS